VRILDGHPVCKLRNTPLPKGFNWMLKVSGQLAEDKSPAGNQLGLGGFFTLRRNDEWFTSGDSGLIIRNELYLPPVQPLKLFGYELDSDQLRFLGFIDYGTIHLNKFESGDNSLDGVGKNFNLTSIGWGLRYRLRKNLTFRLDHGFQLSEQERSGSNQQFHFSLGFSF
jgi:hemolysin activation/secretion protein